MPREAFYNPDIVRGEPFTEARGDMFAVEWAPDGNYAVPGGDANSGVVCVAGVYLDLAGLNRLIRSLNRARRKAGLEPDLRNVKHYSSNGVTTYCGRPYVDLQISELPDNAFIIACRQCDDEMIDLDETRRAREAVESGE